ncbi:MAG: hypothetical protein VKL60_15045 [Sphaerospermopsis sp.]|nr:hypothetical protein [Sphaerospermopsis sp.]
MKQLIKKAILILLISLLPAAAGNHNGFKWANPIAQYELDPDLPLAYNPSNLQLIGVPKLMPSPYCFNCIHVKYLDETNRVPASSSLTRFTTDGKIYDCTITVWNNYKSFSDPEVAYKNFIDHEMIHCLGGGHTATFTGFKFSPFDQPLMASVGRTISPGLTYDDKNLLWEIYDTKITKARKTRIVSNRQFDNIFLVNKIQKKYSLSKYGGINATYLDNVLPGEYYIGVRPLDLNFKITSLSDHTEMITWDNCFQEDKQLQRTQELKWVCQMEGEGFGLCDQPATIWIQKNKRIKIL